MNNSSIAVRSEVVVIREDATAMEDLALKYGQRERGNISCFTGSKVGRVPWRSINVPGCSLAARCL